MTDLEKRARMAAESILENEAIREGLDENGASALLEWGTTCAIFISKETGDIVDDEEALEAIYPRLSALKKMLESVKNLCKAELTIGEGIAHLTELLENANLVYGLGVVSPKEISWNMFTTLRDENKGETILNLRELVESKNIFQEQ